MNDINNIRELCSSVLSDDIASFRHLINLVDDFVSSDRVYDLDENLQRVVFALQEDLARFDPLRPNVPDLGFLSAMQACQSIRLFLNQTA